MLNHAEIHTTFYRNVYRLPPAVLANKKRGLQAADWYERLDASRAAMAVELDRLEQSALARRTLDLTRRRRISAVIYYGAATLPKKDLNAHVWVRDGDEAVVGCLTAKGCHILARYPERNQVCGDLCKLRQPYFHTLFPQATAVNYTAIKLTAEKISHESGGTEASGQWLARLAQTPDNFLRERMAGRWLATCQRSARLDRDVIACTGRLRQSLASPLLKGS